MQATTREVLSLFIEKAEKLKLLNFTTFIVKKGGLNLKGRLQDSGDLYIEHDGSDDEAVDAFVLTFRFFIQDKDGISFRRLNDHVLNDPAVSDNWKLEFARVRSEINQFLDSPPDMRVVMNGQSSASRREILFTFIYGDLAHADLQKRQVFEDWRRDQETFQILSFEFQVTLVRMLDAISYMAYLSKRELR